MSFFSEKIWPNIKEIYKLKAPEEPAAEAPASPDSDQGATETDPVSYAKNCLIYRLLQKKGNKPNHQASVQSICKKLCCGKQSQNRCR